MAGPPRRSEPFTYDKSWDEIETKLQEVEREQNKHLTALSNRNRLSKQQIMFHMRQFKGLQGASTTLRWVLGDARANPLEGMQE